MLKFTSINKENPSKIDSKVRSRNFDEIYANFAKQKAEVKKESVIIDTTPDKVTLKPIKKNGWL
mgnify:CR=1 FL=1